MEGTRFSVDFIDQEALDQFRSLPKQVQIVLGRAIRDRLEVDPASYGKPLRKSLFGYRRLRVGTYRIIYKIDAYNRKVIISAVDHRKDVYDE